MPSLNVSIPHHLTENDAILRMKNLFREVVSEYAGTIGDLQEEWTGNSGHVKFSAMGMPLYGTVFVTPSQVDITAELPFTAMMFKGMIESTLREKASKLLL